MKQLLSMGELSKSQVLQLLAEAKQIKQGIFKPSLQGKILGVCFFEPSTRTRLSFEIAMKRLGGDVVGFSDVLNTSQQKGESLADAIKVIGSYVDALVIRHPMEGAAQVAATATAKPVINAGDGTNEHPTQTLLDLFTIEESQGRLDELNIVLAGDLLYGRAVHSLVRGLTPFRPRLFFVSTHTLQIPPTICEELKMAGVLFSFHTSLEEVLPRADILYMTRLQKERAGAPEQMPLKLTLPMLQNVRPHFKILHPLPRVQEIACEVDHTPYAHYFTQAENGVPVRAALLAHLLGGQA